MSGSPSAPAGRDQGGWRRAARLGSVWTTPALLLAVPTALIVEGRDGLWLALLFVVAPLVASLASASTRGAAAGAGEGTLPVVAMLLVVGLLVWANLSLAGDIATWMGLPRWRGIVPAAGVALGLMLWPAVARHWPWLLPVGLVALMLPLVVIVYASHSNPIATWSRVASQPAFRFSADSPWVTEGRSVGPRRGSHALLFEEEHRVTPVGSGPLRIEVSDLGRLQVQEWTLAPGQSVTLRPGDRLQVDSPSRFKFEADKRVPGAPVSGIAWADSSRSPRPVTLIRLLGLGLTLVGGALGLVGFAGPTGTARTSVGLSGLVFLVALGWAECWALYAVRWAPEFFLAGTTTAALLELPALVLRGSPWGSRLAGVTLVGLFALFLAASAALRKQLAVAQEQAEAGVGSDRGLWIGIFGVAALAALWPVEPSSLVLSSLGLAASTRSPFVLFGTPADRPGAGAWAAGLGLVLFLGLTAVGRLGVPVGAVAQALVAYPALVAAPVAAGILRVARRPAGP